MTVYHFYQLIEYILNKRKQLGIENNSIPEVIYINKNR